MQPKKGYVSFVLHAHLPFIHHPESDDYLEESWLYEAISETYIPLLTNFKKLVDEILDNTVEIKSNVPDYLIEKYNFINKKEAVNRFFKLIFYSNSINN